MKSILHLIRVVASIVGTAFLTQNPLGFLHLLNLSLALKLLKHDATCSSLTHLLILVAKVLDHHLGGLRAFALFSSLNVAGCGAHGLQTGHPLLLHID